MKDAAFEDVTVGMAEAMLAQDDSGTLLLRSVMADLQAEGVSVEDIKMLYGSLADDVPETGRHPMAA